MPRRASSEAWGEAEDEQRGANLMLWSHGGWDPHLQGLHPAQATGHHHPVRPQVRVERVQGPLLVRRGFSSVKLLPGTQMLVALKTEEVRGRFASYLTVLSLNGSVLMEDTHVKDVKYEGLEVAV
jgi:soluble calcium-activated nucleotidase 1